MKAAAALAAYLAGVLAGGAALSPWLWRLAHSGASTPWLAHQPFHRYVHRCMLALAVAGLWPTLRCLRGARNVSVGGRWQPGSGRDLALGALAGSVSLGMLAIAALLSGARALAGGHTALETASSLGRAALSALAVGALEEWLFRGALQAALRGSLSAAGAAWVTSVVYAISHGFKPAEDPAVVTAASGFAVLGEMLRGFVDPDFLPALAALACAGLWLSGLRERTGALWRGIGVHAAWIFWLKAFGWFTAPGAAGARWLWGGERLFDGAAAVAILAAAAVWTWRSPPARARP